MNTSNLARYSRLCASARILAMLVFIIAGSVIALGQQITGTIVGTVKDQQGAVVNTATVKATNVDTGFSALGADKRLWRIPHRLSCPWQVHRRGDGCRL